MNGIQELMQQKYETWEWNFGFSLDYNFIKAIEFRSLMNFFSAVLVITD